MVAGPRHGGEQVVPNLVVEPAEQGLHHGAAADVARRQDLTAKEVQLLVLAQDQHPLVVGREGGAHVQAGWGGNGGGCACLSTIRSSRRSARSAPPGPLCL